MLHIIIPAKDATDAWDERTERFVEIPGFSGGELLLEHSLVSVSKWEESSEKPFLDKEKKTTEEVISYIKCMALSPYTEEMLKHLSSENFKEIDDYINRKMTATIINETAPARRSNDFITAEIIYYWMVSLQIPLECQYWHLNKLITLVRVINLKNQPDKKLAPTRASMANRRAMNARNRALAGSKG